MTKQEFYDKFHIKFKDMIEEYAFIGGLDKLYLEFVGNIFDDYHASRLLPGFQPDSKMKMLLQMKDKLEIIIAINS